MIKQLYCINISSKDPERLVKFYTEKLQIPILEFDKNYDGVSLGFIKDAPSIFIWDEKKWGPSSEGKVNLVFNSDDVEKTYQELLDKGVQMDPPTTASWGGRELNLIDPDGHKILIL